MRVVEEALQNLRAHYRDGRPSAALTAAWQLLDSVPDCQRAKLFIIEILNQHPDLAAAEIKGVVHRLLNDPGISPSSVAPAGWRILRDTKSDLLAVAPDAAAGCLEEDEFAQDLLKQAFVTDLDVELKVTAVRRWLLLSDRWREFPRATAALVAQAQHNDGAWLFDGEERVRLDADPSAPVARAYRPQRPQREEPAGFADPVTRSVAEQYEGWPYPSWTRATVEIPTTLAATIRKYDPDGPDTIPPCPGILIAGCGTGQEAAQMALQYPDARITAIDISRTSLDYATKHCAAAGLGRIEFKLMDLHRVSELGRMFDAICCGGVLHHLPDPEAGWAALTNILKPGGVMRVMVYSKIARFMVRARRNDLADLLDRPVDDDLLREARRRLIETGRAPRSDDFYTLGGVYDLLHRHEDPFEVSRIQRDIEQLGLVLLRFHLLKEVDRANYRQENPQDPLFRDYSRWQALELRQPLLFGKMYRLWCRKQLHADSPHRR